MFHGELVHVVLEDDRERHPHVSQINIEVSRTPSRNECEQVGISSELFSGYHLLNNVRSDLQVIESWHPGDGDLDLHPEDAGVEGGVSGQVHVLQLCCLSIVNIGVTSLNICSAISRYWARLVNYWVLSNEYTCTGHCETWTPVEIVAEGPELILADWVVSGDVFLGSHWIFSSLCSLLTLG